MNGLSFCCFNVLVVFISPLGVLASARADLVSQRPLAVERIVFAQRTVPNDPHWYANIGYAASSTEDKRYGRHGKLSILDLKTGKVVDLIDDPNGAVRDPQVHYDGKTILFSYRPGGTDAYHLYTIQSDGSGLRQLTRGGYDDFEPTYLPDGRIMFVSTRCRRWVNCWLTQVAVLHTCAADGSDIQQVSANIEHDNTPWPLPDGRVLYQRWEYIDRSQVHYHHLWTMNPDGTGQMVYYGNQRPGIVMIDAKPVLDTEEVVAIFSPGHGRREHAGHVTLLSQRLGPDDPAAVKQLGPDANCRDPFAVTQDLFLVAWNHQLRLVNRQGRHEVIYSLPEERRKQGVWLHEPRPLQAHGREQVLPLRVVKDQTKGTFFLHDVYQGRRMAGVKRGTITELVVVESLPKPINYTGGMDPLSYGGTFTLERILGTVPVARDGSAYFEAPALRSLFFIAMDKNGNAVKRMQSFTSLMPGETMGCVGCHESRSSAPPLIKSNMRAATLKPPAQIQPIADLPQVFDFPRDIQPILDKHCATCHNPQQLAGGVLLTGDHGPMFSHSYYELTRTRQISDGRNQPVSNRAPYTIGAVASRLLQRVHQQHQGVTLSEKEVRYLRYWVEVGAPYPGTYAALGGGMIGGYAENKQVFTDYHWPERKAFAAVIKKRCSACHKEHLTLPTALSDEIKLSFWKPEFTDVRLRYSRHRLFNLTDPAASLMLRAPLAKAAGGLEICPAEQGVVFASIEDPDYKTLLALPQQGHEVLQSIKRFDMPGYVPPQPYVREMKRYGVLPQDFDPQETAMDIYQTDRAYWMLFDLQQRK